MTNTLNSIPVAIDPATNEVLRVERIPATDVTGMTVTPLFMKSEVSSATDYNGLVTFIHGLDNGFKASAKLEEKCNNVLRIIRNGGAGNLTRRDDYMIGYSGNTHNGTLLSVWSSYGRKATKKSPTRPADYGIRVSKPRLDELRAISPAIELLTSNFKFEDSNEYRGSFYSFNDLMQFFVSLAGYMEAATTREIIEAGANVG